MLVFGISDLHTDYDVNLEWVSKFLNDPRYKHSVLIVAGDISDNIETVRQTLLVLRSKFAHVFFIPGNHDVWVKHVAMRRFNATAASVSSSSPSSPSSSAGSSSTSAAASNRGSPSSSSSSASSSSSSVLLPAKSSAHASVSPSSAASSMPESVDSIHRFHQLLQMCDDIGVHIRPTKFVSSSDDSTTDENVAAAGHNLGVSSSSSLPPSPPSPATTHAAADSLEFVRVIKLDPPPHNLICSTPYLTANRTRRKALWVIPLYAWYDRRFDTTPMSGDEDGQLEAWMDSYFCKWPSDLTTRVPYFPSNTSTSPSAHEAPPHLPLTTRPASDIEPPSTTRKPPSDADISRYFLSMNENAVTRLPPLIDPICDGVVTFSHYVPRLDLLPDKNLLAFKALYKVCGNKEIDVQLRKLRSQVHLFGHIHINIDVTLDGVRYVQNALKYPREHKGYPSQPKLVWQDNTL